jgi:tetratricopeptide (TPR) repeat protein
MSGFETRKRRKRALELARAGRFADAKAALDLACRADPRDAESWCLLGAINGQLGASDQAIVCCERAIALSPAYADAHYNLAQAHMHLGHYAQAAVAYEAFLKTNSAHTEARNAYALALDNSGRHREAIAQFCEVLRSNPQHADAWYNLGNAFQAASDSTQGAAAFRRAIELKPEFVMPRVMLGLVEASRGELDEAQAQFDTVRKLDPGNCDPDYGDAIILEKRGDFLAAWERLKPHYESRAEDGRFFLALAKVARHVDKAREAAERTEDAIRRELIPPAEAGGLHFALGQLYDQLREYDRAFTHFAAGNALAGAAGNGDRFIRNMSLARATFTADFFARAPRARLETSRPILIVGMPRSGTTLTEQILHSHAQVHGGGELSEIGEIAGRLENRLRGAYPASLASADPALLDEAACRYLARLTELSPDADRVTDKMPHNFIHLGLIALLFPRARIVHCHRNPLDNCFSIFTYEFSAGHGYATDLRSLGEHYRAYRGLMAHWRQVLPLPVFDLPYEQMVADQEGTTRRLLDFLELPFDENCLRFYESRRVVNTISYDQVRRPIYKKSVERWRHYESHLAPVIEALGDGPPA